MGIEKPSVGAIIYIDESVLSEKVSLNYGLVEKYTFEDEKGLVILQSGNEKNIYKDIMDK